MVNADSSFSHFGIVGFSKSDSSGFRSWNTYLVVYDFYCKANNCVYKFNSL